MRNSHPAGSVQLERPKGLSTATGGVAGSDEKLNTSCQSAQAYEGLHHDNGDAERMARSARVGSVGYRHGAERLLARCLLVRSSNPRSGLRETPEPKVTAYQTETEDPA